MIGGEASRVIMDRGDPAGDGGWRRAPRKLLRLDNLGRISALSATLAADRSAIHHRATRRGRGASGSRTAKAIVVSTFAALYMYSRSFNRAC